MWFCRLGYTYGTAFIDMMFSTGLMASFTKAASILGIMMVGRDDGTDGVCSAEPDPAYRPGNVGSRAGARCDFPGFMSIALLFGYVALIKKGWKPINLILLTMVIGLVGALIHIF